MNDVDYLARRIERARAKSILAFAGMSNEAKRAKEAFDQFGEALGAALIKFHKDIYYSWRILPDRKDNLN